MLNWEERDVTVTWFGRVHKLLSKRDMEILRTRGDFREVVQKIAGGLGAFWAFWALFGGVLVVIRVFQLMNLIGHVGGWTGKSRRHVLNDIFGW